MTEAFGEKGISSQKQPFWLLFVLGTSACLAGNLSGWIITLGMLFIFTSDQVVEGYAWLTAMLCWTLVPLVCVGYGLLAGWRASRISHRRTNSVSRFIAIWGFVLGAALWLVLGLLSALAVTYLAQTISINV